MAKGTREIRRKIKSVKNTKQITKAMELVAASKMRRAVANTLALRPYARLAEALLKNLSSAIEPENKEEKMDAYEKGMNEETEVAESSEKAKKKLKKEKSHPLLAQREVKNALVIVIATDRGLCGGLNTQLFRKLTEYMKTEELENSEAKLSFIAIGKKAQDFLRRMNANVIAAYNAFSNHPTLKDSYPISKMVLADFGDAKYDKVTVVYTDFVSPIVQKPTIRPILPLSRPALQEMIQGLDSGSERGQTPDSRSVQATEYIFEPSAEKVLEMLLPRLTEMQVYQSILEATASEHSARMFAMRNATDSASEMIGDLTLQYNQMRQAAITAELAEISAGRAALG